MSTISHESQPSEISVIGILRESTAGTEATGDYRGMTVTNFKSVPNVNRDGVKVIAGYKGAVTKNEGAQYQEVSWTMFAGSSSSSQAALIDVIHMMLDLDAVTGSNPYTHTFDQASAIVSKKSWSIYHDDGDSDYRVCTGFVANEVKITCDKTGSLVSVEVSGFARQNSSTTSKTVNFEANYNYWPAYTGKLLYGSDTITSYQSFVITIGCNTTPHMFLSGTAYPVDIDGNTLNVSVEISGDWNTAASSISSTIRDAFIAGTTLTSNLVLSFGSSATNDYFTMTIPRWELQSEESKGLEPETNLPQTFTAYPVWDNDISNNGWKIEILNTISTDYDTFSG